MSGRSTDYWTACCQNELTAGQPYQATHTSSAPPPTSRGGVHLSGVPLCGGCTLTPNRVGPNRPYLSFCSEPFHLEQCTLGIALVPQGTKQFIALNGEQACSARQAEAKQQQAEAISQTWTKHCLLENELPLLRGLGIHMNIFFKTLERCMASKKVALALIWWWIS